MKYRMNSIFSLTAAFILLSFNFNKKARHIPPSASCVICDRLSFFYSIKQKVAHAYWNSFDTKIQASPLVYFDDSLSWLAFSGQMLFKDSQYEKIDCPSGLLLYKMNRRLDSVPFHMENKMSFTDSTLPYYKHAIMFCSDVESTSKLVPEVRNTEEWLQLVMHEYFHTFQFNHRGFIKYFADSIDVKTDSLNNYYIKNPWFSGFAGRENGYLLRALNSSSIDSTKYFCWLFLETREKRRREFIKEFHFDISKAENFWEKVEGTARYIEYNTGFIYASQDESMSAKCDTLFNHFSNYLKKDFQKQPWFYVKTQIMAAYYYVTGFNLCRVMDKLSIPYKEKLFDKPSVALEDFINY